MSTIQPTNASPVQARARELIAALPQDADAEGRIQAAAAAVDRLESEFPGTPEAGALKLARIVAGSTQRGVTKETVLNLGLDLCRKGAVAGSSYLAGAALELAGHGWDDADKNVLLEAGYGHLRQGGVLPQPAAVLDLAEKHGDVKHKRVILDDAVAGGKDLPGLASSLVRADTKSASWRKMARGLLEHLAQDGPQELRGTYGLALTMVGSWFKRLGDRAQTDIYWNFLADPVRQPSEAAARAGDAVMPQRNAYGNEDLGKAAHRAMEALAPQATPRDQFLARMARAVGDPYLKGGDGVYRGQAVLATGLQQSGQAGELTGQFLAGAARLIVAAMRPDYDSGWALAKACNLTAESAPDGRWRAAFRDLGRLLDGMKDSYYDRGHVAAFDKAMEAMANLATGEDPVDAMVRGVSSVAASGDPAAVIGDFLGGRETGPLKNTPLVREILAVLAEDGAKPTQRATARFVHRAMESGDLKEGVASLKDAFEIQRMAEAVGGDTNPNAIQLTDESVTIGGVVIRRKNEGTPA